MPPSLAPLRADLVSTLLPSTDPGGVIAEMLPVALPLFFRSYFNRKMLRLNHTETRLNASRLWSRAQLAETIDAMWRDGKMSSGSTLAIHPKTGGKLEGDDAASAEAVLRFVEDKLANGVSFVFKFEYVEPSLRPLHWLSVPPPRRNYIYPNPLPPPRRNYILTRREYIQTLFLPRDGASAPACDRLC